MLKNLKISRKAITTTTAIVLAVIVVVAILGGFYFLLPSPAPAEVETIPIGFISELTGLYSVYGIAALHGAELAVDVINARGGVLGKNVALIVQDDQTTSDKALSAMLLLDTQYKVPIVTGPQSSDIALALKDYAEAHEIVLLTGVANHPGVTKPGTHWGFKTQIDGVRTGVSAARFIMSLNKSARIAYVALDNALGRQSYAGFEWEIDRQGGNLVDKRIVPPTQTEFSAIAAAIKIVNPDYIWNEPTATAGINLYKELIGVGFRPDQIVYSWTTTGIMKALGSIAQGVYLTLSWDYSLGDTIPAAAEFHKAYVAKVKDLSDYIAALQYQALLAIAAAIEKAGSLDRTKIRDALYEISVEGIFPGPISYDKNGAGFNHQLICQSVVCNSTYYLNRVVTIFNYAPDEVPVYELAGVV